MNKTTLSFLLVLSGVCVISTAHADAPLFDLPGLSQAEKDSLVAHFDGCADVETHGNIAVGGPSLSLDKTTYEPGETITVTFAHGPGNATDWIGIYPKGITPGSKASTLFLYTNGTSSGGGNLTDGSVTFPASSLGLGQNYRVWFLANGKYTPLGDPVSFSVQYAPRSGLHVADAFGEAMVLQREAPVPVWGTAKPGTEVTVTFAGQNKTSQTNAEGRWQVTLDPMPASAQGRTFSVISDGKTVTLENVLVGEVWFCSGQSNMELGLASATDGKQAMAQADYPLIRLRFSNRFTAASPQERINGSPWRVCSPENIANGLASNSFSAVGYFFGRKLHQETGVPVGLILAAWGSTAIEPWTPREGYLQEPELGINPEFPLTGTMNRRFTPTVNFNGMVHPFIHYAIRGVIWYQGETNVGQPHYDTKMRALIKGWRTLWNQGDFPFYYVQLAPFNYGTVPPDALPQSWEAQAAALSLPETGIALISDVTNRYNIHPANKLPVGERLARLALSRVHGVAFPDDCGPIFSAAQVHGNTIAVSFLHTNSGLATRDGNAVSHFEIAGEEGDFLPAQAIIQENTVVVSHPQIASPARLRFAWDQGAIPNLMNGEGLPALAFRWQHSEEQK